MMINHPKSSEMYVKTCLDNIFGVISINMKIKLNENSKPNIPENNNVKVKTVDTKTVSDVKLAVMNVVSLGNKMDCAINHITDNILDIVGIIETWFSNDDVWTVVIFYIIAPEILEEGVVVWG